MAAIGAEMGGAEKRVVAPEGAEAMMESYLHLSAVQK
jgi:hypothetical protein